MAPATVPTGQYADRILDVYSRTHTMHPPISQFQEFFSQFGPILTIFHLDKSRHRTKPDHTFVIFKNEDSMKSAKIYLLQRNAPDVWTKSCSIVSGIKTCPDVLMDHIESIAGKAPTPFAKPSQAGQTGSGSKPIQPSVRGVHDRTPKHQNPKGGKRNESYSAAASTIGPNKTMAKKTTFNQSGSFSSNKNPPPPNAPLFQSVVKGKTLTPSRSLIQVVSYPSTSTSNLAQEAANPTAGARSQDAKSPAPGGEAEELRRELERMKVQCSKLKSECDRPRMRQGQDLKYLKAEAEKYRTLKTKIERLKRSLKGRDENTHGVMKLMFVALQKMTQETPDQSCSRLRG